MDDVIVAAPAELTAVAMMRGIASGALVFLLALPLSVSLGR